MNNLTNHPHILMLAVSELNPNPTTVKTHKPKEIRLLSNVIERFGFLVPIIIDENNLIVAGHARLLAAKLLGLTHVPVIRVQFVTEADRRAFALAENRLAQLGGYDQKLLTDELTYLFDNDYSIELTGYTLADIDFTFGEDPAKAESVELPAFDAKAVSQIGDLWHIGPHRLHCGDSTVMTSYEALLAGERATMIFSDPPYNVPIAGHVSGNSAVREFAMASGEMTSAEFTAFLRAIFRLCAMFSTSGSIHFHCIDWRHMREMLDAHEGIYKFKQLVVWDKGSGGMGTFYRSQHELIFVFKSGANKHVNNFGLGETGRYRCNIWSYSGSNTFRKGRDEDLAAHPTVKSLPMVMDAILDCSNRGDIILDPFSGSGTTLAAAHKTGRRGAAIEIDPLYVDTALARLAQASGLTPIHADGRTFDEVAADRLNNPENNND